MTFLLVESITKAVVLTVKFPAIDTLSAAVFGLRVLVPLFLSQRFSTDKALVTKAVVANCVVLVPAAAVGAAGVPVKVGEANGA